MDITTQHITTKWVQSSMTATLLMIVRCLSILLRDKEAAHIKIGGDRAGGGEALKQCIKGSS